LVNRIGRKKGASRQGTWVSAWTALFDGPQLQREVRGRAEREGHPKWEQPPTDHAQQGNPGRRTKAAKSTQSAAASSSQFTPANIRSTPSAWGAVSVPMRGEGRPYSMRRLESAAAKQRIAAAAAALVVDGEAVCVDGGTTGAEVARQPAARRLTVMPFSFQALDALAGSQTARIILPGGSVSPEEGSFVGPLVAQFLRGLRFDTVFLSCC
jgi:hypothetical protein